jgi:hypothetical protein
MAIQTSPACSPAASIRNLIPFAHVADVDASLAFYALLGFVCDSVLRDEHGRAFWASAKSERAEIMFARADGPIAPEQQAVLFYMYSQDVAALRAHLISQGLHDGGPFRGQQGPNNGRRVVFAVSRPDYMKAGEVRVADPDGYCILVGQLE